MSFNFNLHYQFNVFLIRIGTNTLKQIIPFKDLVLNKFLQLTR